MIIGIRCGFKPIILQVKSRFSNKRLFYSKVSKKRKSRNLPTPLLRDTKRSIEIEVLYAKVIPVAKYDNRYVSQIYLIVFITYYLQPGVWVSPLCPDGRLYTLDNCPARSLLEAFERGLKLSSISLFYFETFYHEMQFNRTLVNIIIQNPSFENL